MPHNIYVQGSYIDIHDCETVNLSCNGAEVHVDKQPQPLPTSPCETEPAIGNPDATLSAEDDDIDTHLNDLTDEQVKANPNFAAYFVDHTAGVYPTAASGFPWSAASIQSTGDAIADLTEDLAADGASA